MFVFTLAGTVLGNGVSLNSPGTRAISMGGAYISIVDDYSAPYWNPAGLMNVSGMQASFFVTDIIPMASYERTMTWGEVVDADADIQHYRLIAPNVSFLWTCKMHEKLHLGLSMIVPAGLGVKWKGEDYLAFNGPEYFDSPANTIPNTGRNTIFNWESYIGVLNLSLSAAYQFGDKLNVGGAFHLIQGSMTLDKGIDANGDEMIDTQFSEESDGWGYGFGVGTQYMATDKITIGASLRTKMSIDFEGEAENPAFAALGADKSDFKREITWPLWVGGGVAFQATDKLLLAAEAQWSQWSETQDELVAEYDNVGWDTTMAASEDNKIILHWEDAMQIRFGAEYLLKEQWALRGGFYIDPAPGPDETQTFLIPNTDFNVITAGVGYKMDKLSFDLAFEYLMGKERDIADDEVLLKSDGTAIGMPGKHNLNIFVPSFAVTYKF